MSINNIKLGNKTISKAEKFLNTRENTANLITNDLAKSFKELSAERRELIGTDVEEGKIRESLYPNKKYGEITSLGNISSNSSSSFNKQANSSNSSGSFGGNSSSSGYNFRGSGGSVQQAPEVYSPLWVTSNYSLPRDRPTVNAWSRAFFALQPPVQNAISLHSTYPISKLNIKHKDKKVAQFFEDMKEEIDLVNVCAQIAQEYWVLGEAFPYAEFNQTTGKWNSIRIQNPDHINVLPSIIPTEPVISLRPDDNLKRIVNSNRPEDVQQRQLLNRQVVEHVKRGENIPLSNISVYHIARKIAPYDIRGTGLIVCIFKALMLWDKFKECKFAQADGFVNPLTLIKIGSSGELKPSPADLDAFREVFENAAGNKDWKIFTHDAVTIERVGASGAIYDTSGDMDRLLKEIYTGLIVPQVLMDGGSDTTYTNGSIALDVLKQRYLQFQEIMSYWLKRRIFAPIAKCQEFYEYRDGHKKVLQIPDVEWNHMNLFDVDSYIGTLKELTVGESAEKRVVSRQTLFRSLGLDYEDEKRKIKQEAIDEEIFKKEAEGLKDLTLDELRTMSKQSDNEIQEAKIKPTMGEESEESSESNSSLPGLDPSSDLSAAPSSSPSLPKALPLPTKPIASSAVKPTK